MNAMDSTKQQTVQTAASRKPRSSRAGSEAAREQTSLEKGLALISQLAIAQGSMTLGELARASGFNRTTAYRLFHALERAGWVQQVGNEHGDRRKHVDLGPRLFGLAVLIGNKYDPKARLGPTLQELAQTVGETVHVGVLSGTDIVHIARAIPDEGPHLAVELGSRQFAHVTALGKALLATLPPEEVVERYPTKKLPVPSSNAMSTRDLLLTELDRTRSSGYALDDEESRPGVKCVGVPIFGPGDTAFAAISVTTTPARLEGERLTAMAAALQSAGASASQALGGVTPPVWLSQVSDTPR
jgi:DNA-binding IclR family transcriptional regulator